MIGAVTTNGNAKRPVAAEIVQRTSSSASRTAFTADWVRVTRRLGNRLPHAEHALQRYLCVARGVRVNGHLVDNAAFG